MKNKSERILVIQTAYLGDAILTLPMIQKLKEINSKRIIDVVSIPSTREVFVSSPYVDNVFVIDKRKKQKGFRALYKFIRELKINEYSQIYCPHRSFRSALITFGLRVRETYGFDKSALKFIFKYVAVYNKNHHEVQRNLSLIGSESMDQGWRVLPKINVSDQQIRKVDDLLSEKQLVGSFIAIAPGSVWNTKRYPKDFFVRIINSLIEKREEVVLIGGVEDKSLCQEIQSLVKNEIINFAGYLKVPETVYLLQKSKLLITNDSAPTHLGMSADIPVLTLYCSTVPAFGFHPYNNKSSVLSYDDLDCKPCGIHGHKKCPIKTFDCGYKLLPENVINEAQNLM